MCVELTGKICLHQLTAAIKEAYKANEDTMSRIVLEHGIAYYEKLSVSGCKTMITDKNWIELVKENEKLPFAIDKGELVRTFIIPAETDTQIMIMTHHLAGDGKSIIYLINNIMNALAKNDCYSDRLAKQTAKIMGYIGKTRDIGITNLTVINIPVLYGSYKIKNIIFVPPRSFLFP